MQCGRSLCSSNESTVMWMGIFFDKSRHEGVCANGGLAPDIHTQPWYKMFYVLASLTRLSI